MFRRCTFVLVASSLVLLALAGPAGAHVTADPRELPAGGFAVISFRVPTESETASTTKLEVQLPANAPFAFVSVRPTPGWSHAETTATLPKPITTEDGEITEYTATITWEGGKVAPGEFQQFDLSVGPIPDVDKLVFKAVQTYDDGEVVRWIEEAGAGEEAEHPAPSITVTKAAASTPKQGDGGDDSDSDGLALIALVVGALGLVAGAAALASGQARRRG
jgi:uncharacterized protein YcnI